MSTSITPRPTTGATPWRVIASWAAVPLAVSIVGVLLGIGARRRHEVSATAAVVVNGWLLVALTFMTLGEGLIDAFRCRLGRSAGPRARLRPWARSWSSRATVGPRRATWPFLSRAAARASW